MKPEAKRKINVRDVVIGAKKKLICVPVVAKDTSELLQQSEWVLRSGPDLIEWRADAFILPSEIESAAIELRKVIKNIPIVFTLRHSEEGGINLLPQAKRAEIISNVLNDRTVDILDLEVEHSGDIINLLKESKNAYAKLILSHHDFEKTPSEEEMLQKMLQAEKLGADIVKIAVMTNNYEDVLRVLGTSLKAKQVLEIPTIIISMGKYGFASRIAGGYFGSDIIFASGSTSSAPGQLEISELQEIIRIIDKNYIRN